MGQTCTNSSNELYCMASGCFHAGNGHGHSVSLLRSVMGFIWFHVNVIMGVNTEKVSEMELSRYGYQ